MENSGYQPEQNDAHFELWAAQFNREFDPTVRTAKGTPLLELGVETSESQLDQLYDLRSIVSEELHDIGARAKDIELFERFFTTLIVKPRYLVWHTSMTERVLDDEDFSIPTPEESTKPWAKEAHDHMAWVLSDIDNELE